MTTKYTTKIGAGSSLPTVYNMAFHEFSRDLELKMQSSNFRSKAFFVAGYGVFTLL